MSWIDEQGASQQSILEKLIIGQKIVKPSLSDGWTLFNQGNATLTQSERGIELYSPGNAGYILMGVAKSIATPPYTVTALVVYDALADENYMGGGIGIRESSTGKSEFVRVTRGVRKIEVIRNTDDITWNSTPAGHGFIGHFPLYWIRLQDDGTNRTWMYSLTGFDWVTLYQTLSTDYLTPDQFIFYINPQNSIEIRVTLASWNVE